jgi:hypothetical protein
VTELHTDTSWQSDLITFEPKITNILVDPSVTVDEIKLTITHSLDHTTLELKLKVFFSNKLEIGQDNVQVSFSTKRATDILTIQFTDPAETGAAVVVGAITYLTAFVVLCISLL